MSRLNPQARPFVPISCDAGTSPPTMSYLQPEEDNYESNITPEELEELEATEEWVRVMADIDEMERQHLIELALRFAPQAKVNEIQRRFGVISKPLHVRSSRANMRLKSRAL